MSNACSYNKILDTAPVDSALKAAALRVSPSVVSVITHNVPDDMILKSETPMAEAFRDDGTYVCPGSGVIIESNSAGDFTYLSTILCPASLFKRTNDIQPHQIQVDVRVSGGRLYKAELLDCDFHYNIAAIRIQSDASLQPAILRHLTDITTLGVDCESDGKRPFKLQRHSDLNPYKIEFGTKILVARRSYTNEYEIIVSSVVFGPSKFTELYSVNGCKLKFAGGGAVINYHGEVIGICVTNASFFPSNLVSRWWDHYRSRKEFLRPCLGVKVANLCEAPMDFLKQFVQKFPKIVTGVVVTKVENNSPAHQFGIMCDDVIIKCNGNPIRSKLEFLERVWDYARGDVEMDVLKAKNGGKLNLNITIGEIAPNKLYEWELPYWINLSDCNVPECAS